MAGAPSSTPTVIVALTAFPDWQPAPVLECVARGPRRYPRDGATGDGLACCEHDGRSVWLLRASWNDLDDELVRSDAARRRVLRALSFASFLIVELPPLDRLHQARSAVECGRRQPSRLDRLDRLRQCLRDTDGAPSAVAVVVASPHVEVETALGRLCRTVRLFDTTGGALRWLLDQRSDNIALSCGESVTGAEPRRHSSPGDESQVVVLDWGGETGHRLLWSLHAATERASQQMTDEGVRLRLHGGVVETRRTPAGAACGRWALEFGPPPRAARPAPCWQGTFAWRASDVQRAYVTYETDIARADVIVACVGHDVTRDRSSLVAVLELSWLHAIPVLLVIDRARHSARRHARCPGENWVANGFPDAPTVRLSQGAELNVIARALALVHRDGSGVDGGGDGQERAGSARP